MGGPRTRPRRTGPADVCLRDSDTEQVRAAPESAGKLLEPLSAGADSDRWSAIGGQLDGYDSDTSGVSQQFDSRDSDTPSVSQELDMCDNDTSSVSNDSEVSHTLESINVITVDVMPKTTLN